MTIDAKVNKNLHGLAVTVITAVICYYGLVVIIVTVMMLNVGILVLSRKLHDLAMIIDAEVNKNLHRLAVTIIIVMIYLHGLAVIIVMVVITWNFARTLLLHSVRGLCHWVVNRSSTTNRVRVVGCEQEFND